MKKLYTIMLILIGISYSYAQSNIEGYMYWFNNDFANKTTTTVTPTQQLIINQNIPTTGLSDGINSFNFRSFDNSGKYSTVASHFFYKTSALENNPNPQIIAYEYWIDNDYASAVLVNTPAQQQVNINELISMSSLSSGIHNFNIRFKDNANLWSSVASHFFYKTSALENNPNPQIIAYEYWINNDYANAVLVNTPLQQQVNVNELISMSALNPGIHSFNIRFKDNANLWSSVANQFFYKTPPQIATQNLMTDYRYWLDNDFVNAVSISLQTPIKQFNLIDNLDFTQVPKGVHTINFQFKDSLGMWSSVTTDTINKLPFPIADFSFSEQIECDSTIVSFTDLSIDGDVYLWDFGDGNTDTLANPIHAYYTPNTYQVSLTITDTLTGLDSTFIIPITIHSLNSSSSVNETICDSYTAPDGQVYTTSGIKTAIIPNTAGCDSTITIDLTILNSTTNSINETICDSYTAPDGQTYTTSGIKTAIIPNTAGCDSTITIDLTILNSTTSSINEDACNSYTALDGQVYTSSGIITAIIPNAAGCDSTMTIDLNILQSTTSSVNETACDSYTAPDGQVYTTSGVITAVIPNAAGCDSIMTIDLTINTVNTSVTQNGITLTADEPGLIYQWLDCNNGYLEIIGETNQSFTASQNGRYAVEITQNNCVDTSACFDVTSVGIMENTFDNTIIVYPNPTSGMFTVDLGRILGEFTVSITDMKGKAIHQTRYRNTEKFEMNLDLPSGIYMLIINSGNDRATIRLIKN